MAALEHFIVEAKANTYVGRAAQDPADSRTGSHDISYMRGEFRYLDSYFGGTDFVGQEIVWVGDEPVWAMNYYGRILKPELLTAGQAGTVITTALSALYVERRFLGGFTYHHPLGEYLDESMGDHRDFLGNEKIFVADTVAYRLDYHGGIIKP